MKLSDIILLTWLAIINLTTFLAFGLDKWRAGRTGRRIPENTLLLFAGLGGWPGGLFGLNLFRHKTAKWTFKFKYALAAIPFAAGLWAWWHFH
jgi:uncharacterized membrane protein YsdA (DUF1294 family)